MRDNAIKYLNLNSDITRLNHDGRSEVSYKEFAKLVGEIQRYQKLGKPVFTFQLDKLM